MTPREARDRAQFILGAVSLVLWLFFAFVFSIAWFIDEYTPQPIFIAGGIAFVLAAVPWLAYPRLVHRFEQR